MAATGGFTAAVWALARRVPPGRATTYGMLAEAHYGVVRGARGVGAARGRRPPPGPTPLAPLTTP